MVYKLSYHCSKKRLNDLIHKGLEYEKEHNIEQPEKERLIVKTDIIIAELKKENEELKLDPLTKINNRHYYNELQTISKEQEYYVSVVDLNGLKTINDTQGHMQGDIAIKELSEFLNGFGEVIRMGGDEFLVISDLPYIELSGRFEKYCSATVYKAKGMDLESAYDSADKQMLREKKL